jgi:hypothetical protein
MFENELIATTFRFSGCDALLLADNGFLLSMKTAFIKLPRLNKIKKKNKIAVYTTYPNWHFTDIFVMLLFHEETSSTVSDLLCY